MKKNRLVSTLLLENDLKRDLNSYLYLLKPKLNENWLCSTTKKTDIFAVPQSYSGDVPKQARVILFICKEPESVNQDNYDNIKTYTLSYPLDIDQVINSLNKISSFLLKDSLLNDSPKSQNEKTVISSFKESLVRMLFRKKTESDNKSSAAHTPVKKVSQGDALLKLVKPNTEKPIKVVLLGRPGSGKTTLVQSAQSKDFVSSEVKATDEVGLVKSQTTIGLDYCEFRVKGGRIIRLFGTPGQGRYSHLQMQTVRTADICVILVDLSSKAPYSEFKYYYEIINSENLTTKKIIVFTHSDISHTDSQTLSEKIDRKIKESIKKTSIDPRSFNDVNIFLNEILAY